jgi:LEA14-like dessication related protein
MGVERWIMAGAIAACLSGCGLADFVAERQAISRAEFALDHVDLQHADVPFLTPNGQATLNVVLAVTNPNPVTARLDRMDYTLQMQGTQVGSGSLSSDFAVDPAATKDLTVPVTIPYAGLPQAVLQAIQARQAQFVLQGQSHIATPFGDLSFPVTVTRTEAF